MKKTSPQKPKHAIEVTVHPEHIPNEQIKDSPQNKNYFRYTVKIKNSRKTPVKLISRYWLIIEDEGEPIEVEGQGVVGKHPIIQPNKSFSYQSFSSIHSPWGTMEGHYVMIDLETEEILKVNIDRFYLIKKTEIPA